MAHGDACGECFHCTLRDRFPVLYEFADVSRESSNRDILGVRASDVADVIVAWLSDVGLMESKQAYSEEEEQDIADSIKSAMPLVYFGALLQRTGVICWPQDRGPEPAETRIPLDLPEPPI